MDRGLDGTQLLKEKHDKITKILQVRILELQNNKVTHATRMMFHKKTLDQIQLVVEDAIFASWTPSLS